MHKKLIPPAITPALWKNEDGCIYGEHPEFPEESYLVCDVAPDDNQALTDMDIVNAVAIAAIPSTLKALETALGDLEAIKALALPGATHIHTLCDSAMETVRNALLAAGYTEAPES